MVAARQRLMGQVILDVQKVNKRLPRHANLKSYTPVMQMGPRSTGTLSNTGSRQSSTAPSSHAGVSAASMAARKSSTSVGGGELPMGTPRYSGVPPTTGLEMSRRHDLIGLGKPCSVTEARRRSHWRHVMADTGPPTGEERSCRFGKRRRSRSPLHGPAPSTLTGPAVAPAASFGYISPCHERPTPPLVCRKAPTAGSDA